MTSALISRTSVTAAVILFFYNGLLMGVYAGGLATLKARIGATDAQLSVLFAVSGVVAITAIQIYGRLVDRVGTRLLAVAALAVGAAAAAALAAASSYSWLVVAATVFGMANGMLAVVTNAVGVHLEDARGKPAMSFFHGMWSVGSMAGAAALAVVEQLSGLGQTRTLVTVLLGGAVLGLAVVPTSWRTTPETRSAEPVTRSEERPPKSPPVYLLGAVVLVASFGDGVATNWSTIHAVTVSGVSTTTAALTVLVYSGTMLVLRLTGGPLVARFGRRAVIGCGAAVAMAGCLVITSSHQFATLLVGWALVGGGLGNTCAQAYGAAAQTAGSRGLATVVTFSWGTYVISPALIGQVIDVTGLQHAMIVPAALFLALIGLSRFLPTKHPAAAADPRSADTSDARANPVRTTQCERGELASVARRH